MMKKVIAIVLAILSICVLFTGCFDTTTTTLTASEGEKLSFKAEFYDNKGEQWFSAEGSHFNISPNKVKEYYYSNEGVWTYHYEMSSIVSVDIDGHDIESCGSTIIFYDTRLEKQECVLPEDAIDTSEGGDASIKDPGNYMNLYEYWTLDWWFITKDSRNETIGPKVVVIQSQEGAPICLFSGENVKWEVSENLPKTTEITIDGKKLYVHRSNFAVIDTTIFH